MAQHARHRYQKIRHHAHRVMTILDLPKRCVYCGYDYHVELAHLRDIADFPEDATLMEINDPSNLAYLCRNHHKEQEDGHIHVEGYGEDL
jgi:hypothetical protein